MWFASTPDYWWIGWRGYILRIAKMRLHLYPPLPETNDNIPETEN